MRLTDENLRGRTIISADGQIIGNVTALVMDTGTWRVESLYVKLAKHMADELGAEHSWFHAGTLEISVRVVQSVGPTIVLSVSANRLRELLPDQPLAAEQNAVA